MLFGWDSFAVRSSAPVVAVFLFAVGCGKGNAVIEGACRSATPSFAEAQAQAQKVHVSCFSEADCNPSVGMLSAAWAKPSPDLTVCTSFLIGPDVLATNSHCLPSDLTNPGDSCSGRIWALFPSMKGHQEERLECESLISNSGSSEQTPGQDIAFLRLKTKSSRPVMPLSRDGFEDQETVKLVKINPEPGQGNSCGSGIMQTVECETRQHSSRLPSFDDRESPVVSVASCSVVHGNSGGPLLDSQGRAKGIIQAYFYANSLDPSSLLAGEKSSTSSLNIGTNLACVKTPLDSNIQLPVTCKNLPGVNDQAHEDAWIASVGERMQEEASAIYAREESESPTGIQWKSAGLASDSPLIPSGASNTTYDEYFVPVPKCVGPGTQPGTSVHTMKMGHFRRGFDQFLVPSYETRGYAAFQLTLTATLSNEGAYIELSAIDSRGRPVSYFQGMAPACN